MFPCLILFLIYFIVYISANKEKHKGKPQFHHYHAHLAASAQRNLTNLHYQWTELAKLTADPSRTLIAKEIIAHVAGIYSDPLKVKLHKTEKTVLVSVIAYDKDSSNERYLGLLRNYFCSATHFGLRPITYLVPSEKMNFTEQVKELLSVGIHSEFITYPTELFWNIIAKKKTQMKPGYITIDYNGIIPSFSHFGALTMLIPTLEVLEMGYNVVYLDIDVSFVHNPIPGLLHGNADFSVSIEMKTCIAPSVLFVGRTAEWSVLEPNTGIMHVRSTPQAIILYQKWLQRIVDDNVNNDQKVLDFTAFGAEINFSCNKHLEPYSDELIQIAKRTLRNASLELAQRDQVHLLYNNNIPKYCFLNEFEYQNGKVALGCARNRGGSLSEYILGLIEQNLTIYNETTNRVVEVMSPSIVHLNYCDDKIGELKKLGLWLPTEQFTCNPYSYEDTNYAKTNWTEQIYKANKELDVIKQILTNGTVLKLFKRGTIFMYIDGMFRPFPNGETFEIMGYKWNDIRKPGPYTMLKAVPHGDELPDLKNNTVITRI